MLTNKLFVNQFVKGGEGVVMQRYWREFIMDDGAAINCRNTFCVDDVSE